jgi:hypothetical protein
MKIIKIIFLTWFILGISSCSTQSRLIRQYNGKTQEELLLRMGRPTRVEPLDGGRTVNIYEKSKFLKAAAINTGQFQYDKFESPKAIKNEIYKFFISSSGVIVDVKYEISYEH